MNLTGSVQWSSGRAAVASAANAVLKGIPGLSAFRFPYGYSASGAVPKADNQTTSGGLPFAQVIGNITANPSGYYATISTAKYPDGAVRGQFKNLLY